MSIVSLFNRLPGGIAQGLIWGIMALGVYITFRVLNESDLTVDGSFATGGAVAVMSIYYGVSPVIALLLAFISGILCGICTGLITTKLKIPAILSGILVQLALYVVNLHIMNMSSNVAISLDANDLFISIRNQNRTIFICIAIAIIIIALMYWYFGTEQGCAIRATGNSNHMAIAQGINIDNMKVLGFALGNGLVALAGAILSEYQGYSDINMGRGAIVIGLAAIIIGEAILKVIFKKGCSFYTRLSFVIAGGILYYIVMILILWLGIDSNDLKLFTALIVMVFLAIPNLKRGKKKYVKTK